MHLWKNGGRCFGASEPVKWAYRPGHGSGVTFDANKIFTIGNISRALSRLSLSGSFSGMKYLKSIERVAVFQPEFQLLSVAWIGYGRFSPLHDNRMMTGRRPTTVFDIMSAPRAHCRTLQRSADGHRCRRLIRVCERLRIRFLPGVAAAQRIVEFIGAAGCVQTKFRFVGGKSFTRAMGDFRKQPVNFRDQGHIRTRGAIEGKKSAGTVLASTSQEPLGPPKMRLARAKFRLRPKCVARLSPLARQSCTHRHGCTSGRRENQGGAWVHRFTGKPRFDRLRAGSNC